MALDTIGSIATNIAENFNLSTGISGNLVELVDMSRVYVQNFTGQTIGSNSIDEKYQHAILWLSQADVIDLTNSETGGDSVKLGELSVDSNSEQMSADQFRNLANKSLGILGRKVGFRQAI